MPDGIFYKTHMSLSLRKMTPYEFDAYLSKAIPKYASQKEIGEDLSPESAAKIAEESYKTLLPDGLATKDQHLFSIMESTSGQAIGILWYAYKKSGNKEKAFIYDIEINEGFRGKGYGLESMKLLEAEVSNRGLSSIGLHVFGHNATAIGLYKKLGYQTTNMVMSKNIKSSK